MKKAKEVKRGTIPEVTVTYLDENKKKVGQFNYVCFAGLGFKLSEEVCFLRYLVRNHVTEDQAIKYLAYCFRSFPNFMSCLEEKSPLEILKDGASVNVNVHSAMKIMSAWTAIRYIEEYPEVLEWWDKALEIGIDEDMAFVMAHHYTKITIYNNLGGHGLMEGSRFTLEEFHKFNPKTNQKFRNYLDKNFEQPFSKCKDWKGIQLMFKNCFDIKGAKW